MLGSKDSHEFDTLVVDSVLTSPLCATVNEEQQKSASQFDMNFRYVKIDGRIHAPAKCELRSVTRFLQAEGCLWKAIIAAESCQTLRRLRRAVLTSGVVFIHDALTALL
ncbi:hypothetical protein AVEN_89105-1 [Araneus ventricosus]|uniref:Uncharacterized protein n=1 Tax=Araneus ventricosus TaxID=182803 RepID=A0A4Y2B418_ARAVE|nr:hypothetical protein AVEN_89105-1 [Araneus ventricosus]